MSTTERDARLAAIKQRTEAIIPGPWGWYGNVETDTLWLATRDRGRLFILTPSVRVEEHVFDFRREVGYLLEEARESVIDLCGAHAEANFTDPNEHALARAIQSAPDSAPADCRCDEIRDFLTDSMGRDEDERVYVVDGTIRLARQALSRPDLRFPVREADADRRKQHGGYMRSYRDLARYEVLDGRTIEQFEREEGRDHRTALYRRDIVGLDQPEADFIAHAAEDIPFLLAEVEHLRKLNPQGSLSYECSDCGAEVDIREASAL